MLTSNNTMIPTAITTLTLNHLGNGKRFLTLNRLGVKGSMRLNRISNPVANRRHMRLNKGSHLSTSLLTLNRNANKTNVLGNLNRNTARLR